MTGPLHLDSSLESLQAALAARGVTERIGTFGDHRVRIGDARPVRIDRISSPRLPFQGFRRATRIERGLSGADMHSRQAVTTLAAAGRLDAGKLLGELKASQAHAERLAALKAVPDAAAARLEAQRAAVRSLSSNELARAYEHFTSAEMDLLQTALLGEIRSNPKASDARAAADALFDLQAVLLKEASDRIAVSKLDDAVGRGEIAREEADALMPAGMRPPEAGDIAAPALATLVETAASSAALREKGAAGEAARLAARGIEGLDLREIGDVMRRSDLTINMELDVLLDHVLARPDESLETVFSLAERGILPKGEGYIAQRDATERLLFPELDGHEARSAERPVYGALNIKRRSVGATTDCQGYGSAALVLRPEVLRRSTFTADDSFYSPAAKVDEARRATFFTLLPAAGLSEDLAAVLSDPLSPERAALEAWFDRLAGAKNLTAGTLGDPPAGIPLDGEDYGRFTGLLVRTFGDRPATRSRTATFDNLESLVTGLDDMQGNAFALAALKARGEGAVEKREDLVVAAGLNYIEAQVHGGVVPSRDVAEIRISLNEFNGMNEEAAQARVGLARELGRRLGVPVKFFRGTEEVDGQRSADFMAEFSKFNAKHMDSQAIAAALADIRSNPKAAIDAWLAANPEVTAGLAPGRLRLEGAALDRFFRKLDEAVQSRQTDATGTDLSSADLVRRAASTAARSILPLKAQLLHTLDELEFPTPAARESFEKWVVSAGRIRSGEELRAVHEGATALAGVMRRLAAGNPGPVDAPAFFRDLRQACGDADAALARILAGFEAQGEEIGADDHLVELDRMGFNAMTLLTAGNPPLDAAALERLRARLDSPEIAGTAAALRAVMLRGGYEQAGMIQAGDAAAAPESPEHGRLYTLTNTIGFFRQALARTTGEGLREPEFNAPLHYVPESARTVLRELAPETAARLDADHPAFRPFPQAARPEALPRTAEERQHFLMTVLEGYRPHEAGFDRQMHVHGRGHVIRASLFAQALCGILEEMGLAPDRTAVACGIAGHDIGREGNGRDVWEEQSAAATCAALRNAFGADAAGPDWEAALHEAVTSDPPRTLEGLVLKSADSLDIGRVATFDPGQFRFLEQDAAGTGSARTLERLRRGLAEEADRLERLTNPYCARRDELNRLQEEMMNGRNSLQAQQEAAEGKQALLEEVWAAFDEERNVPTGELVERFENVVRDNPRLFPLLNRYFRP